MSCLPPGRLCQGCQANMSRHRWPPAFYSCPRWLGRTCQIVFNLLHIYVHKNTYSSTKWFWISWIVRADLPTPPAVMGKIWKATSWHTSFANRQRGCLVLTTNHHKLVLSHSALGGWGNPWPSIPLFKVSVILHSYKGPPIFAFVMSGILEVCLRRLLTAPVWGAGSSATGLYWDR